MDRIQLLSLMLAGVFAVFPAASGQNSKPKLSPSRVAYDRGKEALQRGDFLVARDSFQEAVRLDSGNAQAHASLGIVLVGLGMLGEAERELRSAIKIRPGLLEPRLTLAGLLAQQGKTAEGEGEAHTVLKLAPNNADAHRTLGRILIQAGSKEKGTAELRRAVALAPRRADLQDDLGTALAQQGNSAEAAFAFGEALRLEPNFGPAHFHLGVAELQEHRLDDAVSELQKAIELVSDDPVSHYYLAEAFANQSKNKEAVAELQRAAQLRPDWFEAQLGLGIACQRAGDTDGAVAALQQAVKLRPDSVDAETRLGLALQRKGEVVGAASAFRTVTKLQPDNADAHNNLGLALIQSGDAPGAVPEFEAALRLKPDDSDYRGNLGIAYLQRSDFEAAIRELKTAIIGAPDDVTFHYNLGLALKLKDDLPAAITELQKAQRLDPAQSDAHYTLGVIFWQQGDLAQAASELTAAIKARPDYAEAHYTLGTVLKQQGKLAEAAEALREAVRLQPDYSGAHITLAAVLRWSHAATENPQGSQQIFTQGQHFSGTAFELDGTDNQDPILGIIVVNPNLDAVTEAKVALQNYDAEFGKAVGSVVTAQTKSGSNQLHGSGFLFRRSDAQLARNPFTQYKKDATTGRFISPSRWVQFGGTVGGAIIKDKLFFFGDYQGTRQTNGASGQFTLPTNKVRSTCTGPNGLNPTTTFCDLSEYLTAVVTGGGIVYDPTTGNLQTGSGRTAFPGNLIPNSQLSPAAVAVLQALPAPATSTVLNNFTAAGSGPFKQDSFDTRIDYAASSTVNVFGRFSLDYFKLSGQGIFGAMQGPGNGLLGLSGSSITHNYSLATGFTKTLSPSLLTDFRFGYFKYNPQTQKPDGGTPMTNFGIPGANIPGDPKTNGLGAFLLGPDQISGQGCTANSGGSGCVISSFGDGLGIARCNCPLTESEQQFQFVNNWTKTRGNHIFKFGADIRYAMNLRIPSDNNRTGEYNFSPEGTSNGTAGGLDLATFLLADVTSFARYVNNPNIASASNAAERQKRWFFYGQDTFRATSKLTLSYGLRWELYFPETVNGKGNGGFANIRDNGGLGGIRVGGYGPYGSNGNVQNNFHAFAPRLGIAYQITPKTVVRAGYGRSYDIGVFGSNFGHTVTQNLPVLLKQNYDASTFTTNAPNPNCTVLTPCSANLVPLFSLDAGPNANIDPASAFPAIPSDGFFPLTPGLSGTHLRPIKQVLPEVDAWNLTVQRQVTNTVAVEVAYVGSKGTHGFAGNGPNYDVNPAAAGPGTDIITPAQKFNFTPFLPQTARRPLCGVYDPVLGCSRIGFDLGNYYGNDASSNYNAFEVKLDKRFSQGLQFLTHYTFSHANGYPQDNYYAISHPLSYGPVDFARNHVFVFNTVYELPFGKGKKYMNGSGRAIDYALGGWQLSNTTNWSSGLPWTATIGECGAVTDTGPCRPDKARGSFKTGVSGGIDPVNHNLTFFTPVPTILDPATLAPGTDVCALPTPTSGPFALPACGTIGNIGKNTFHGPRGFYSDLSLVKKFHVGERFSAQFRTDFFNVFNHPVYAFSANNGGNPCVDCQGGNNGKITNIEDGTSMRQIQFAIRFDF